MVLQVVPYYVTTKNIAHTLTGPTCQNFDRFVIFVMLLDTGPDNVWCLYPPFYLVIVSHLH